MRGPIVRKVFGEELEISFYVSLNLFLRPHFSALACLLPRPNYARGARARFIATQAPSGRGAGSAFQGGEINHSLPAPVAAGFERRLKEAADLWSFRPAVECAAIIRFQVQPAHAGGFALWHARQRRRDRGSDAACSTPCPAFHSILSFSRSDERRLSNIQGMNRFPCPDRGSDDAGHRRSGALQGAAFLQSGTVREIAHTEVANGVQHIDQGRAFLGQAILDTRRNLRVGLALHDPALLKHLETLRKRFRTDTAQSIQQFTKAFGTRNEIVYDRQ